MIRFAHSADWHPRSNGTICGKLAIDPDTGLSRTLTDFKNSLTWFHELMVSRNVDILFLAGDIFDTSHPTMDEIRVVMDFITLCRIDAIQVVMIPGNHDLSQNGVMSSAIQPIKYQGIFCEESPRFVVIPIRGKQLRVDCLPYPTKGRLLATRTDLKGVPPEELNALISDMLKGIVEGFRAHHEEGEMRVLLAHGSVVNAEVGEQPRTLAHDIFIPLPHPINPYHYTALGHIHKHQYVNSSTVYSGSLLRNGFGEEHEEKGVVLGVLDLEANEGLRDMEFVKNPHARVYETIKAEDYLDHGAVIQEGHAYRIKGEVTPEQYQLLQPSMTRLSESVAYLQSSLEVITPDRMRDEGISTEINSTDALDRSLDREGIVGEEKQAVLTLHETILEEARS